MGNLWRQRSAATIAATSAAAMVAALAPAAVALAGTGHHAGTTPVSAATGRAGCQLANGIRHVIDIQFDNVHLTRDNPNVPSDLEQMPHLLSFLEHNGTMFSNAHDVLSHTATNFTANQSGLYEDRTSITQSNSFYYYDRTGQTHLGVSFAYWTDPLYDPTGGTSDTTYNVDYTANRNAVPSNTNVDAPAPWVTYTRAGCNVGDVGMSNQVLENIGTDIPTVFGANSPQEAEAKANPDKATADFVGLAVHCAAGSPACAKGQTDALPDEPRGYHGYRALFGNAEVAPAISPKGPVRNLDGQVIADYKGNVGFPGFDGMTPTNALGYTADMLEHGVQVTNTYISDVHDDQSAADTGGLGPGSKQYETQLRQYDASFATFLKRLAGDGITPKNSLFVVTTDEGDHFSGSAPTPANCTGLHGNYCTYTTRSEVNVNLPGLLATKDADTTAFAIHNDPAPALWVEGNPKADDPKVRNLERELSGLSFTNPLTGGTDKVADYLADPAEEKILHFVGPDAARTPTLTAFSGEDDYVGGGAPNCTRSCVYTSNGYAWNHGSLLQDMTTIWMAMAGPGVRHTGVDRNTWVDQTDTRPTVMALTGLRDDYQSDGRVLIEDLEPSALPASLNKDRAGLEQLGAVYKQLLGDQGLFAHETLVASTNAVASGSAANDSEYTRTNAALTRLDNQRDALTARISDVLLGAAFAHRTPDRMTVDVLMLAGWELIGQATQLAVNTGA